MKEILKIIFGVAGGIVSVVYRRGKWYAYQRVSPSGGRIYRWNGTKWVRMSNVVSRPSQYYKTEPWIYWPRQVQRPF